MASVTLTWSAAAASDNVTAYKIYGANGTSVAFGSCALLASVGGLTWTDIGLPINQARTYYIVAHNAAGDSSPEGPINITTAGPSSLYVQNAGGAPSVQEGTHAARPLAGNAGAVYIETDTKAIFRDNGASWDALTSSGVAPSGTPAQGDIIYYDGSAWQRLAAGTNGNFLKTQGAGANPVWAAASGGGASASIRSSNIQSSSNNNFTVTFPAGATAGDLIIIMAAGGFNFATPTGWTQLDNATGTNFNGIVCSRVLTTNDINTGSVVLSAGSSFNAVICCLCFTGAPTIKNISTSRNSTGANTRSVSISGAGQATTDFAVFFGLNRNSSTDTIGSGSAVQSIAATSASGVVTAGATGAISLTDTVTYGTISGTTGDYQGIIILAG